MKYRVGSTVIGTPTSGRGAQAVGIVLDSREFFEKRVQAPVHLLKVRFQSLSSTTGIYLSTEHETLLLNKSDAPHSISLLQK